MSQFGGGKDQLHIRGSFWSTHTYGIYAMETVQYKDVRSKSISFMHEKPPRVTNTCDNSIMKVNLGAVQGGQNKYALWALRVTNNFNVFKDFGLSVCMHKRGTTSSEISQNRETNIYKNYQVEHVATIPPP